MSGEMIFTFVLDFKGGTYISQVSDISLAAAMARWANTRTDHDLAAWGLARIDVTKLVETDTPVALAGCHNVWCLSSSTDDGLILVNVIATAS
jgi:hypothetical protein